VTAPISREDIVKNIVKYLPTSPVESEGIMYNLPQRLTEALTKKPDDADLLIKIIKKHVVKKLGMSDGRLNKKNMELILGPPSPGSSSAAGDGLAGAGSQIASLEVMDPNTLFEKTARQLMKTSGSADREIASEDERKEFLSQIKAYVRGLTQDDMKEVISTIINRLGLTRSPDPGYALPGSREAISKKSQDSKQTKLAAGYSRLTQKFIKEELYKQQFRNHVREILLMEKLTKTDVQEVERISRKEAQKEITKAIGKDLQKTIKKEVEKTLKNKATKDELATITKTIMKKLYKDIAVNYPQTIDRIKV
jgi:hypothetical protein